MIIPNGGLTVTFPLDPRSQAKLYAMMNGLSWLPCPACGNYFGGHEHTHRTPAGHIGLLFEHDHPFRGIPICRTCALEGVGCISHAVALRSVHPGCLLLHEDPNQ